VNKERLNEEGTYNCPPDNDVIVQELTSEHGMQVVESTTVGKLSAVPPPVTCVIQDCAPVGYIDVTGLNALKQMSAELRTAGVRFILVNCNQDVTTKLSRFGLTSKVHRAGVKGSDEDVKDYIEMYSTLRDGLLATMTTYF